MLCVKVTRPGLPGGYTQSLDTIDWAIDAEFDCPEVGDKLILEVIEMDEEEYNNLPDFEGW